MPKRRILVPVDFSECSRDALRFAVDLARKLQLQIDVLHVWEPTPQVSPTSLIWMNGSQHSFWNNLHRDLEHQLEAMVSDADPDKEVVMSVSVIADYVAGSIVRKLETEHYEMCVIGTRGRTGLARLLLGSVAARIVRLAPCPVITVPAPEQTSDTEEVHKPQGTGFDLSTPTNM